MTSSLHCCFAILFGFLVIAATGANHWAWIDRNCEFLQPIGYEWCWCRTGVQGTSARYEYGATRWYKSKWWPVGGSCICSLDEEAVLPYLSFRDSWAEQSKFWWSWWTFWAYIEITLFIDHWFCSSEKFHIKTYARGHIAHARTLAPLKQAHLGLSTAPRKIHSWLGLILLNSCTTLLSFRLRPPSAAGKPQKAAINFSEKSRSLRLVPLHFEGSHVISKKNGRSSLSVRRNFVGERGCWRLVFL